MSIAGFGLGLRTPHYEALLTGEHRIDWLEAVSENYLVPGGKPLEVLHRLRERYPLVLHGVSLSIGSIDPLDRRFLAELKALADRIEPAWVSDHLCWTGTGGTNLHDLLPLPYTEEALDHLVPRIAEVQDVLQRRFVIENVSTYLTFNSSQLAEWDFLRELVVRADCDILLDVNNVYVNSVNHGFDPVTFLRALPRDRIRQIHLAGHSTMEGYLIDTHDHPIIAPVWDLYRETIELFGAVPTMIERDDDIPALGELLLELDQARRICGESLAQAA
jgi:uncharacterized protein